MQTEKRFSSVDAYIASFPPDIQMLLDDVRSTVRKAAPGATERISYGVPAYHYKGEPVVYFGGFKKHIGIFATPEAQQEFQQELSDYKQGKGSVKFPFAKPLPLSLITRIVKFKMQRLKEEAKTSTATETPATKAKAKSVAKAGAKTASKSGAAKKIKP